MVSIVQAPCPSCQRVLRIPSDWVGRPMRCKHCGLVFQATARASTFAPVHSAAEAATVSVPATPAAFPSHGDGAFAFGSEPAAATLPRSRRRSGGGWTKAAFVMVCLLAVFGTGGYFAWRELQGDGTSGDPEDTSSAREHSRNTTAAVATRPDGTAKKGGTSAKEFPVDGPFPRRALVVGVSNYVYANPVSYFIGTRGGEHHPLERIGAILRIPPDQIVELSDAAKAGRAVPPLKPVIEQTVQEFLEGCRAQDRILVAFIGHAVEIEEEPYLVPIEGELAVAETLIPLKWLLEQMGKCRARQKVLILDVCRYDPGRGLDRPGSGPLGAKFEAALQSPPEGVQILSACAAGQQSLEGESGGIFFQSLEKSLPQVVGKRLQKPDEALPIEALAPLVKDEVELTAKQTPRLTGKEPEGGAAYNPEEKPPAKLVAKMLAVQGETVPRAVIQAILDELDLPPVKPPRVETPALKLETIVPFSAKTLEAYKADYNMLREITENPEKYPLRVAVLDTATALRKHAGAPLHDFIAGGGAGETTKKAIFEHQREPALIQLDLKNKIERLRELAEMREEETKRWQAHYDYVLSQALARLAYVHEYNLMQGKIRKDDLPPLENFHVGHRLAARERLQSDKETRDLAAESKKILQQIIKKHPGTPWEILAKRERFTALGMEWQPARQ